LRISDSTDIVSLYSMFCKNILKGVDGLQLLLLAPSENKAAGLPSWCPDFHQHRESYAFWEYHMQRANQYSASSYDPWDSEHETVESPTELLIRGMKVCQIVELGPPFWSDNWDSSK